MVTCRHHLVLRKKDNIIAKRERERDSERVKQKEKERERERERQRAREREMCNVKMCMSGYVRMSRCEM